MYIILYIFILIYHQEEGALSSSVENQYLYKRGQSGTTPKMSSFFSSQVRLCTGLICK
jgi:hypothetical protein